MNSLSKFEKLDVNGGCIESRDPAVTKLSTLGCAIGRAIGNTLKWINPFD